MTQNYDPVKAAYEDDPEPRRAWFIELRKGSSYFGSGAHTAGYRVLEGGVKETPIGFYDNGFSKGIYVRIEQSGDSPAVVEVWDYDFVGGKKRRTGLNGTFVLDRECPDIYVTPKKDGFVSVLDKVRLSIEKILIRVKPEDRKYELQSYIYETLTEDDIRAWHEGTLTPTTEVITDILNAHGYELKVWGSKAPNAPEPFSVTVS